MSAVKIVRQEDRDAEEVPFICYGLIVDDEEYAELNEYDDGSWQVVFGEQIYGHGNTLAAAMNDALTNGLNDAQATVNLVKDIAVKHGDEIMRLAEEQA